MSERMTNFACTMAGFWGTFAIAAVIYMAVH